jgi:phage terminase large subunit-like protein
MQEPTYSASWLALQPPAVQKQFLSNLTETELYHLQYDWDFWARDKQRLPIGNFFIWVILAGRGFGKTRTGAETVRRWARTCKYVNLIGATADDARDIMIEGESGILAICPPDERPVYKKSDRKLAWPNGAISLIFTADEPERLRGKQHEKIWADEVASWRYEESWDQAMMGLRLGRQPQGVVTSTPKPVSIVKNLLADPRNHITRGTTYENKANLAAGFFEYVIRKYEGTRLGRQELNAEMLTDVPGALWKRDRIEELRVRRAPELVRIVIPIDPAISANEKSNETGIIPVGLGKDGHAYILEDLSLIGSPAEWATVAVNAYYRLFADRIIGEINQGGDMVENTIRTVRDKADNPIGKNVSYKAVRATKGKYTRAEPISSLYEQGKVHHVGSLPDLEDQLCTWLQGEDSPDRLDSLVWGLTEIMNLSATWDDVNELGHVENYRSPWA